MVILTLTLTDPVALRSGTSRLVTAAVPLVLLAFAWVLVWLRILPAWPWWKRRRKGS